MNPPYRKARMAIAAGVTAVLSASLSACGGSTPAASAGSSSPAAIASAPSAAPSPADPLAGLTGEQLMSKALADFKTATSYHYRGSLNDSGSTIKLDVTTAPGKACNGSFVTQSNGTFKMIVIGPSIWISADRPFWASFGGHSSIDSTVATLMAGKWIKSSSSNASLGPFVHMCDVGGSMASGLSKEKKVRGESTTVDGQSVIKVNISDGSAAYVSDTANPLLVKAAGPAKDPGGLDFSDYNAPVSVTPPPADQTLDGKQFGI